MDLNTRVVSSPGYPYFYPPRYLACSWDIDESSGSKINFTFPNSISIYSKDNLEVRLIFIYFLNTI